MPKRKVVIAIPAYEGKVHTATMQALFADVQTVREQGVEVEIITRDGIAIIALARALLVAEFLAGDGTDFVFVDADVSWEPGALVKLLSHPVYFVAGVAPSRDDPIEFRVNFPSYPVSVVPTGSLWEVAGVGTAFMRLTRSVLELMVKAYPETEVSFEGSRTRTPIPGNKTWMVAALG
jgi:hypothetical protein